MFVALVRLRVSFLNPCTGVTSSSHRILQVSSQRAARPAHPRNTTRQRPGNLLISFADTEPFAASSTKMVLPAAIAFERAGPVQARSIAACFLPLRSTNSVSGMHVENPIIEVPAEHWVRGGSCRVPFHWAGKSQPLEVADQALPRAFLLNCKCAGPEDTH